MVLSTALFDKPAFKNLVCNGLVLAADGKKMSKRLKNYPVRPEGVNQGGGRGYFAPGRGRYAVAVHTEGRLGGSWSWTVLCFVQC
jgi:hypothetical protein